MATVQEIFPLDLQHKRRNIYAYGQITMHLSFVQACLSLGLQQSSFDPCLLYFRNQKGELSGILGLSVDDIVGGGDDQFLAKMKMLRSKFKFGQWHEGSGRYCGKDLIQHPDFVISIGMSYFVDSCHPIQVDKARRLKTSDLCTDSEISDARAAIGSLAYLSRESRPDIAGPVALAQGLFPKLYVEDLLEINRVVALAHRFKDLQIHIQPIPPADVCVWLQ